MFVKICGITSVDAADAAAAAGADAVGFVFAPSPRRVLPQEARALAASLPRNVLRVAVFRHPTRELVEEVIAALAPDWLQTDAADLAAMDCVSASTPPCHPLPVYRTGNAPSGAEMPARLLFEGPVSGSGRTADWQEARTLAARTELILAGGLDSANVEAAIAAVRPWGVDVSSGVERAPGRKDPAKIAEFVARARAAANALARQDRARRKDAS